MSRFVVFTVGIVIGIYADQNYSLPLIKKIANDYIHKVNTHFEKYK
jgi:hypothetical protein